jgi:secreted trypsin-like serine protease
LDFPKNDRLIPRRPVDSEGVTRLNAVMIRLAAALACWLALSAAASAMVGGAPAAEGVRHTIMILGSGGTFCSGTAVARDLVLTAAHCVPPGAVYNFIDFDAAHQPQLRSVAKVAPHPQFSMPAFQGTRATPDLALLKLAKPLPAAVVPAALVGQRGPITGGEAFVVMGYGVTIPGDNKSGGTLRSATLVATGQLGNLQTRLVDPSTLGKRAGLGACVGDSGGPVFQETGGRLLLIGVISWTTAPNLDDGCGGITGATPLELYRAWIADTAKKLGSPLAP